MSVQPEQLHHIHYTHTHDHIAIILAGSGLENFAAYTHRIQRLVRNANKKQIVAY